MPAMAMMMPGMGFRGRPGAAAAAAARGGAEEKVERTAFDLKLESFEAAAKIKVIKEVRGFTDLEIDLSVFKWSGVLRWSELDLAGMTPSWVQLDFSILDRILWSFVTAVESVALVAMLCFFLAFCFFS